MQHLKYLADYKQAKEKFLESFENEIQDFLIKNDFNYLVYGNSEYDDQGLYPGVHDIAVLQEIEDAKITYHGQFKTKCKLTSEQEEVFERLTIPLTSEETFTELFSGIYGTYGGRVYYTKNRKGFTWDEIEYER